MGPFGVLEVDPLADDAPGLEAVGKVVQIDSLVDAKPPEISHRPFCRLQLLQSAMTPLFTGQFQAQARRCTRPVESARERPNSLPSVE